MAWRQFGLSMTVMVALGLAFYPALWLARRPRTAILWLLLLAVFLSPLMILPKAKLLRLLAAVTAVMVGFKLYDADRSAGGGFRPAWRSYAASIPNPFSVVLRRVLKERRPEA